MADNSLDESRSPFGLKIKCGFEASIKIHLDKVQQLGYGFLCTPIVPEAQVIEQLNGSMEIRDSFTWSEFEIPEWHRHILYIISNLETEFEGSDINRTKKAEEILRRQVDMCYYLHMYFILIELTENNCVTLANFLNSKLTKLDKEIEIPTRFMIKVPMGSRPSKNNPLEIIDSWNTWNKFRLLCGSKLQLEVALEISGGNIPVTEQASAEEIRRWLGEPVKAIFVHTDVFKICKATGYPKLRQEDQRIVKKFLGIKACVIIEADSFLEDLNLYEWHLQGLVTPSKNVEDIPQLQTLKNRAEYNRYQRFQKNPAKYKLYQDAVKEAIMDKVPEVARNGTPLVLIVAGAGEGRLVEGWVGLSWVDIQVYAVEPNPNTANTLFHLQRSKENWNTKVTVVCQDIRKFKPTEMADIVVYDLLGSFFDCGFAPEFLDVAQKWLKPDGIVIPKKCTAYLGPIMSAKIYQKICKIKLESGPLETYYLANIKNKYDIANMQKLVTFEHPNFDAAFTNDRYKTLTFNSELDCVLHGFVGHLYSTLYGEIKIGSSTPPVFFPLKLPVHFKNKDVIKMHFWRKSSERSSCTRVWFEWTLTFPEALEIHNSTGSFCSMDVF